MDLKKIYTRGESRVAKALYMMFWPGLWTKSSEKRLPYRNPRLIPHQKHPLGSAHAIVLWTNVQGFPGPNLQI